MNILVLIKQVPDTGLNLRFSSKKIEETGLKWVLSPYDEFALEEALKLKPALGGQVFALSFGPDRAKDSLINALALGADEAFHLKSESPPLDPLSIASILQKHLSEIPPVDLILCGKLAADTNDFAVPQMLAELLNIPFITNINSLKYAENSVEVRRECGSGIEEILKANLPLILSADKGLNQPRYPSLPGIMKAKKKPFKTIAIESFEESVTLLETCPPPQKQDPVMISGEPDEQVQELLRLLKEKEKLL